MNILDEVLTFSEACEMWGLNKSTLSKVVARGGRLAEGVDYRRTAGVNLITRAAMVREYGLPKTDNAKSVEQVRY